MGYAWEVRGVGVNFLELPEQVSKADKCGLTEPSKCLSSRGESLLVSSQLSGLWSSWPTLVCSCLSGKTASIFPLSKVFSSYGLWAQPNPMWLYPNLTVSAKTVSK